MSENTVSSYLSDINLFLSDDDIPEELENIDSGCMLGYFTKRVANDGLSKRSQMRILSALKSFFGWLQLEGLVHDNPCDGVPAPKLGRYLPSVLTENEISDIISSVDTSTWNGLRDRAILEVLYGCGLRVSEAAELKISQLFLKDGFVRVIGKGDKQRLVPIGDMAIDAIGSYLPVRPDPADSKSEDILFLNKFGRGISRISVFNMVKRQAVAAGVNKEISPHSFRHSFATHLIEHGVDLRAVQDMLGHESILTTEIYTHIDKKTWQSAFLEHHPGED